MSVAKKPRQAGGRLPTHHTPPASRGTKTRGGDPPRPCSATDEADQRLLPVSFACPTCPRFHSPMFAIGVPVRRDSHKVAQTTGLLSTSASSGARSSAEAPPHRVSIRESIPGLGPGTWTKLRQPDGPATPPFTNVHPYRGPGPCDRTSPADAVGCDGDGMRFRQDRP